MKSVLPSRVAAFVCGAGFHHEQVISSGRAVLELHRVDGDGRTVCSCQSARQLAGRNRKSRIDRIEFKPLVQQ